MKLRRAGLGLCPERMLPRPIADVRRGGYRCLEPGVRELVRELDRVGLVPVWSCEGHRKWTGPPTWCNSPVLTRLTRAGIVWWQRPRVVCAGPLNRIPLRLDAVPFTFLATDLRITRFGCSILRALPGKSWRKAENMKWTLFVQLGPRQAWKAVREGCMRGRTRCYVRLAAERRGVKGEKR